MVVSDWTCWRSASTSAALAGVDPVGAESVADFALLRAAPVAIAQQASATKTNFLI